ncbi:phosphatase PAP2 family protein [Alkalihalobacterium elongatum]|uniref:phosphatase PAP2 family protein n=1 Tax=Alkalihalobacterium elongatum TaxID=2675466 RepID=UPI001C1FFDD9|nr:phosphatase PAP2 family protein [Alkalihalobacterium elongatum]
MNQTEILVTMTELQNPFLNFIALILTFLGNEEFYMIILPLVYWCISKTAGFRLFYIFLMSIYINAFFKIHFAVKRPIDIEGVNSIFLESAKVGSHYPYDSFPSGHAQGSATLFGYLAYMINKRAFWIFAITIVLLISTSRLYSGLHWPTDVMVGISLAVIILTVAIAIEKRISRLTTKIKWLLAIVFPIVLMIVFPEEEGIKYAGFLLGAGVGYLLEAETNRMVISKQIWRKAVAFVVGIVGLVAIQSGLKFVFPDAVLFDFIRYGLVGLWGLYIAPVVFVLLKLYQTERTLPTPKDRSISG